MITPLWLTLPARIQTGCITSQPRATLPDPTLLRDPVACTTSESGSAGICHATPGEPCGCRPSLGPQAGISPSWPLARRSQALVKGHLAAVMRWRAPIERPAKGEAVIGWRRDAAGGGGADRGAVCGFELKQNVSTVSPRLPSAPREVTQSDWSLGAFTRKHNTASSLLPTCHCLAATPSAGPNGNSDGYQGGLLISPG